MRYQRSKKRFASQEACDEGLAMEMIGHAKILSGVQMLNTG